MIAQILIITIIGTFAYLFHVHSLEAEDRRRHGR